MGFSALLSATVFGISAGGTGTQSSLASGGVVVRLAGRPREEKGLRPGLWGGTQKAERVWCG